MHQGNITTRVKKVRLCDLSDEELSEKLAEIQKKVDAWKRLNPGLTLRFCRFRKDLESLKGEAERRPKRKKNSSSNKTPEEVYNLAVAKLNKTTAT